MDKLTVLKVGGAITQNKLLLDKFLNNLTKIKGKKILVHGGGRELDFFLKENNYPIKMLHGRRITDKKTLDYALMVYAGKINKEIVAKLQSLKINSIGLCGADANSVLCKLRTKDELDYGYVGDIVNINSDFFKLILENNIMPVCNSITYDKDGVLLNTNADTIASEISSNMSQIYKTELWYCFEEKGVYQDDTKKKIINQLDMATFKILKSKGIISKGMIPKVSNCFNGLKNGVSKVLIGSLDAMIKNDTYTEIIP